MTRRRAAVFGFLLVLALLTILYWFKLGVPVALTDAAPGRIACVSYAPYRLPGESPFDPLTHVSAARIEEDLSALSRRFACVRTYSVGEGLDQVPEIAKRHHMTVLMGIWLSRTVKDNEREMALGLRVAHDQHDAIRAIVVGNEVLLRGELSPDALAADIARVRAGTDLPVTYADVWEYWSKYPQIAPVVSFITIHILPYWEDHPVSIEHAVAHVAQIRARMQALFPGRKFLIGETGWPSAGRQRQGARPSLVNEARFMREFLNWAEAHQIDYNVIEAFDQPWKRLLEGTAGGYWGVYDAALHEKFAMQGPVVEDPRWALGFLASLMGGLVWVFLEVLLARRGPLAALAAGLCGVALGGVAAAQVRDVLQSERTAWEWAVGIGLSAAALFSALVLGRWTIESLAGEPGAVKAERFEGLGLYRRAVGLARPQQAALIRWFWMFCAAVMNLLLCFDARYRDFPIFLYSAPVCALLCTELLGRPAVHPYGVDERVLGAWLILSSLALLLLEGLHNGPALLWVVLVLLLASCGVRRDPFWRGLLRLRARQQ